MAEQGRAVSDRFTVGDAAWRTHQFTAADFASFAEATGDYNPLHDDAAYAAATKFGRTVVPLAMVSGPVSGLIGTVVPGPGAVILGATYQPLEPVHYDEAVVYSARVVAVNAATDSLSLRAIAVQAGRVVLEADLEVTAAVPAAPPGTAACGTFEPAGRRRLAVVTGVPGAIGSATARSLAAAGWDLAVVHRGGEERVRTLIEHCRVSGAEVEALRADLAEAADRARSAEWIREAAPTLLVHAAAAPLASAHESQFEVGYAALRDLADAAIPGMLRRQEGAIVLVGELQEPADEVFSVYLEPGRTERVGDGGGAVLPVAVAAKPASGSPATVSATQSGTAEAVRSRAERSIRGVLGLPTGASLSGGGLGLTEGWDSLRQIQIIVALESEFGVRLRSADLAEARRFEELCGVVAARLGNRG